MKVVVCGAGQVGYSIAKHLSSEHNDVTVIDQQANLVFTEPSDHVYVSDHFGVQVVLKELPSPKK